MIRRLISAVGLGLVLAASSQAALTESPQPALSPTSPLPAAQTPSKLPRFTPEQEAVLVEVRKILKEAREVGEGTETSEQLFLSKRKSEILQEYKAGLISKIEKAQFRAGDFNSASTTKQLWYLALAQVKYGQIQEAIQTAARIQLHEDSLLALVKALASAGYIQEAISVARADLLKENLERWRYRNEAAVLALIAQQQTKAGDQAGSETIGRALKAAVAVKYPPDRVLAFIHVARAQATMGDQAGSADSFQHAIRAAHGIKRDGTPERALTAIALAQAQSDDLVGSGQTFQEAIRLINKQDAHTKSLELVRIACGQVVSGQRIAGRQTFQQALEIAESLPANEKGRALLSIGEWQLKAEEREALAETLERARKAGVEIVGLAGQAGYLRLAMEQAGTISDEWSQAGALAYIARRLVETRDPFGTPEVFQQLSQMATALLKKAAPKDKSRADLMLTYIALVQASAGDLSAAFRTIEMISGEDALATYAYPRLIQLLIKQGRLTDARQILAGLKNDWILGGTSEANNRDALLELTKLSVRTGDVKGTLAWARKQRSPFAQSYALLGMAEASMDQYGIDDIGKLLSGTPLRRIWMSPCT